MKVSELHAAFISELVELMPGWTFVKSSRHFKRTDGHVRWLFHVSFANYSDAFDALGDVAVEYVAMKKRVAIIGAQLANIAGTGYSPHPVSSRASAIDSARALAAEFQAVGLPVLQRYSDPAVALAALEAGGREALLISPLSNLHAQQLEALQKLCAPPNNSSKPTPLRGAA
ncbi:hypothetical protein [Cognatilysobacter terrigena]|uniref:hypothetical protein n=1 Tax=Cognatilysobacter terrigena TaxID=2488749 RepID=UPI00105D6F02|nr:hypothetical protein [Lysobacter terrigena]